MARSRHTSPALRTLLFGLAFLSLAAPLGCTPDKELIQKMMQGHIDKCKEAKGEFGEIKVFDGSAEPILKLACEQPITDIVVDEGVVATAKTGPYTWNISTHPESGVWVVSNVKWPDFHNAHRILEDRDDPDAATLENAANQMASAQEAFPESAVVRAERLDLLLKLRKKTRNNKDQQGDDITGIGAKAQAQYDELLAWSEQKGDKALAASARLMVIDYLKGYDSFLDTALESQGSQDEWLEKSISVAEKEGKKEEAEKYRKELEEMRAGREAEAKLLQERKEKLKGRICQELGALDPQGISDDKIKERAIGVKQSTSCGAQ